ncbi:MAG: hypothetical protein ACLFMZ_04930 [Spirochaetaceae bacterium]
MKCIHSNLESFFLIFLFAAAAGAMVTAPVAAEDSPAIHSREDTLEDALETARRLLVQEANREREPKRFIIDELRSGGEVRESLEVVHSASDTEEEAKYFLNGRRIDPEKDSLGRFDKFEERFTSDEDEETEEEENGREESTPLYETLRGAHKGTYEYVNGRRALVWDVEFDTAGGDVFEGTLYTLPDSGVPLRLHYEANTPVLVSAKTDSYYSPAADGTLQREALEIHFRIGALFLSRTYRIRMEF